MWKLVCLRMLKLLLNCTLISCSRFATLAATDLRRAIGEHMQERACVRVLWVACTREFAGDSAATGVRHFAGIKEFYLEFIHMMPLVPRGPVGKVYRDVPEACQTPLYVCV